MSPCEVIKDLALALDAIRDYSGDEWVQATATNAIEKALADLESIRASSPIAAFVGRVIAAIEGAQQRKGQGPAGTNPDTQAGEGTGAGTPIFFSGVQPSIKRKESR